MNGLQTIPLKEGLILAIFPQNHILAQNDIVSLDDIANEPFILLEEGHYYEPLETFLLIGKRPNIKYTIHDDYAIIAMVEAGLGISILAELVLLRTNYKLLLRKTESPICRTISIGYKDIHNLPIASKRFIKYLQAHISKMP